MNGRMTFLAKIPSLDNRGSYSIRHSIFGLFGVAQAGRIRSYLLRSGLAEGGGGWGEKGFTITK